MPDEQTTHRQRLDALIGLWAGPEVLKPSPWDPQGGRAHGELRFRRELGGLFLVSDYVSQRDGAELMRGHGVYGWDAGHRCYSMHWFDSLGGDSYRMPARGEWVGDTLTFRAASDGRHARYTYAFQGVDAVRFSIAVSPDGDAWTDVMVADYRRADSA